MKKIFNSIFAVSLAVFSFTACEDVPEPYQIPGQGGNDTPEEGIYIKESFKSDFGVFKAVTTKGTPWIIDFGTAKATGYDNASKVTTPSEAYIVSTPVDFTATTSAHIAFEYILRYATNFGTPKPGVENKVLITSNYTDDPTTTEWTDITGTLTEGSDWENFYNYAAMIPSEFYGKKNVVFALKYTCDQNSATWEVKNLEVKDGEPEQGGTEEPDQPGGDTSSEYINETFSSDFGVFNEVTTKGTPWIIDFGTAKASGYDNASKVTTPSESYLVSKAIDLSGTQNAHIAFDYILRYVTLNGQPTPGIENKVLITSNYTSDPTSTVWTDITGTLTEGTDWTTFSKYATKIPAEFIGKKNVVIAFKYACEEKSATWEIKNVVVKDGEPEQGGTEEPDQPAGEGVTINGTTVTLTNGSVAAGTETIDVDLSTLGYSNAEAVEEIPLSDGTKIIFDANGEQNGPKYYTGTKGIRVYKNNKIIFKGNKAIANIVFACDEYNGNKYVGNNTATVAASGNDITYTNVYAGTDGGVQLRIKTIKITYAK